MNGSWRPIMAPSVPAGRPVTAPSVVTGTPSAPKATGAVLKINVNTNASSAGKPTRMRSDEVIATGVPKPADAFQKRAEAEADHHEHDAAIVGKMVENPGAECVEALRLDRDIVEEERVDHDPHDRPESEDSAGGDGIEGEGNGKVPHRNRDDEADHKTCERCLPGRPAHDAKQHENSRDGKRRYDKGKRQAARDRRQQLFKHFLASPSPSLDEPRSIPRARLGLDNFS